MRKAPFVTEQRGLLGSALIPQIGGTKNETSVQIAQRILSLNYDSQVGELNFLKNISLQELMQVKGIGRVKAIQLKAVSELSIRMSKTSNYKKVQVKSTSQVANMVSEEMRFEKREIVKLFLLNSKNEILKIVDIALGGTSFANVSVKEIIGEALKIKAPRIILIHNHPTGDSTPSERDIHFTDTLYNAAAMFEIELLDHIVIGNGNYKSVFEETAKLVKLAKKDVK